jgi:plastocyanin
MICPNEVVGPFTELGKYQFVCTIHRRMAGSFEVINTGPAPTPTPRPAPTDTPSGTTPVNRTVSILGRSVSPKIMRVKQGADLYFANGATEQHWLKSIIAEGTVIDQANPPLDFDTGAIAARTGLTADAASFTRVGPFSVAENTRPGRYGYVCLIYPSMSGAIIVERVDPSA